VAQDKKKSTRWPQDVRDSLQLLGRSRMSAEIGGKRQEQRLPSIVSPGQRAAARKKGKSHAISGALKRENDQRLHRDICGDARPASLDDLERISVMLNKRTIELIEDPLARSWYKLFNHMDDDGSGKIDYHELADMLRNELKVTPLVLSDEAMMSIWVALDEDKSGLITSGEFGHFMQLGAYVHDTGDAWKVKLLAAKKAEAATVREPLQALLVHHRENMKEQRNARYTRMEQIRDQEHSRPAEMKEKVKTRNHAIVRKIRREHEDRLHRHMFEVPDIPRAAGPDELYSLSLLLNNRMIDMFHDPLARMWYKVFNDMDDDGSGFVAFDELEDMVRLKLKVPAAELSAESLKAIWFSLDEDQSGLVSSGEFGRFMQLGAHVHNQGDVWKARLLKAKKAEASNVRAPLQEQLQQHRQTMKQEQASRQDKAAALHDEAWGLAPPRAKPQPFRSPRAIIF